MAQEDAPPSGVPVRILALGLAVLAGLAIVIAGFVIAAAALSRRERRGDE